jgi:hypothetical protein
MYKHLNEHKEDRKNEISEIWKTLQVVKGELNKDIKYLKNSYKKTSNRNSRNKSF